MPRPIALLITDVVDSTALAERLGDDEMSCVWAAHDEVAHGLLHQHRGRELDRSDGIMAAFDDAADATRFGLAYVDALGRLPVPLAARVGIHVGTLVERSNDPAHLAVGAKAVERDGVVKHVASRVTAVASGGQVLLSADAARTLGDAVGLPVPRSHGHWRLKGIDEPIEIHELPGAVATPPPADGAKAYRVVRRGDLWLPRREIPHRLPAERDTFIGRGDALRALAAAFDDGARLVTLTGTGGTGKTRLALHHGWRVLGEHSGGVWFCDLAQARTLDGLLHAVAQGLDVPLTGGDAAAQIVNVIAARGCCLVVLDNFEQIAAEAEATVGRWLDAAGDARFLVTSRELLHIGGEVALGLDPMALDDAATLFVRRAEAAGAPREALADHAAIAPLMKLLDGLPLAIELAAARARVLAPAQLLSRVSERFALLRMPVRRTHRQATLRTAIDWSWDLLSNAEREALARVSVCAGGFTLGAACVLLADMSEGTTSVVDLLQSLVDKSLLRIARTGRFDLLTSIQDYAAEALAARGRFAGSGPAAWRRAVADHASYYACSPQVCVEQELDNLVVAAGRAADCGRPDLLAHALQRAWSVLRLRGPYTIARELAESGLRSLGLSAHDRLCLHRIAGSAAQNAGFAVQAREHLRAALEMAGELGDDSTRGELLARLAEDDLFAGRLPSAMAGLAAALQLARSVGDPSLECDILGCRATAHEHGCRPVEARADYEAAVRIACAIGHPRAQCRSLANLGQCLANQGDARAARGHYVEALRIARASGDRKHEGNTLCNLGFLEIGDGNLDAAVAYLEQALAIARTLGDGVLEAVVLCNLGIASGTAGDHQRAHAFHLAAVAIARRCRDRRSEGQYLIYMGISASLLGRHDDALQSLAAALGIAHDVGDAGNAALALCHTAVAERRAGRSELASAAAAKAEAATYALGALSPELDAALSTMRDGVVAAPSA